jgi:hypothetical protein
MLRLAVPVIWLEKVHCLKNTGVDKVQWVLNSWWGWLVPQYQNRGMRTRERLRFIRFARARTVRCADTVPLRKHQVVLVIDDEKLL